MLDPKIVQLAKAPNFATLSFRLPSGEIGTHMMWIDADEDHVLLNTEVHRAKYRSIQENPEVTVTVWDRDNPYAYGEVRGRVVGEVRGEAALANIHALSRKYLGTDYQTPIQSERVILRLAPTRQRTQGL